MTLENTPKTPSSDKFATDEAFREHLAADIVRGIPGLTDPYGDLSPFLNVVLPTGKTVREDLAARQFVFFLRRTVVTVVITGEGPIPGFNYVRTDSTATDERTVKMAKERGLYEWVFDPPIDPRTGKRGRPSGGCPWKGKRKDPKKMYVSMGMFLSQLTAAGFYLVRHYATHPDGEKYKLNLVFALEGTRIDLPDEAFVRLTKGVVRNLSIDMNPRKDKVTGTVYRMDCITCGLIMDREQFAKESAKVLRQTGKPIEVRRLSFAGKSGHTYTLIGDKPKKA